MIKGSIQQKGKTIVNKSAHKKGAPQHIRQLLTAIKGEIDNNTIIVGEFNTLCSARERSSRQKTNKETVVLKTNYIS